VFHERDESFEAGSVAIVGAGPGSRQLLTLRALDRIQRADVILHDALVENEVLELALPGTEVIDVGRRARAVVREAPEDERRVVLMLEKARGGKRVVRLHAGDPFVFGRGGEEVDALTAAGIPWEVVPGVSAVLAAPAAAGVPLTQRGKAKGFSVRTGHDADGPTRGRIRPDEETVVVLMALESAAAVLEGLIEEGRAPDTPAVAVERASRAGERVVTGTLATLAERARAAGLDSPVTLIVGEVARDKTSSEAARGSAAAVEVA
jgi:uroporphyrin-III C-methyltransferase